MALVIAAAGTALGLGVSAASADATLTATYPISGSTHIVKTDSDLALGPGTLSATVDTTTGAITAGAITLPDATGSFTELGIPVTVTAAFHQVGQVTGSVDLSTSTVTAISDVTLQITDLKVAGLDIPVGPACQTAQPASITVTSGTGFAIFTGGPVSGTYAIPLFENCLLETLVINLVIPGPGNAINLTLGTPTL
jgi:hypothetical protein